MSLQWLMTICFVPVGIFALGTGAYIAFDAHKEGLREGYLIAGAEMLLAFIMFMGVIAVWHEWGVEK